MEKESTLQKFLQHFLRNQMDSNQFFWNKRKNLNNEVRRKGKEIHRIWRENGWGQEASRRKIREELGSPSGHWIWIISPRRRILHGAGKKNPRDAYIERQEGDSRARVKWAWRAWLLAFIRVLPYIPPRYIFGHKTLFGYWFSWDLSRDGEGSSIFGYLIGQVYVSLSLYIKLVCRL